MIVVEQVAAERHLVAAVMVLFGVVGLKGDGQQIGSCPIVN